VKKRPLGLVLCALLFLFFPAEFFFRLVNSGVFYYFDLIINVFLPLILIFGLLHVSRFWWYTFIFFILLWGVDDLRQYYLIRGSKLSELITHVVIYAISLAYFINPRIRRLYFDPKLRWWRTKKRYEAHLPFLMRVGESWDYPIIGNISVGGCFVESQKKIDFKNVHLIIPLPIPLNVSLIEADAEVRWESKNPTRKGFGLEFKNLSPQMKKAVKKYVVLGL